MATLHVVITKEFTFRGQPERFSNGYNFQTESDLNEAYVESIASRLISMERQFHPSWVDFVYAVGGPLGQDAVYAEEFQNPLAGVGASGINDQQHPEVCALAQSRIGPRRYLMKYYHGFPQTGPHTDAIAAAYKTAAEEELVVLTDGTLPGNATYCRPNGALATEPFTIDGFARTHQLKRRGKRP